MKKIVTANINNKSTVIIDSTPHNLNFKDIGIITHELWSTKDGPGSFNNSEVADKFLGVPPPPNGTTFRIVEFLPNDSKKRLMHKTNSLDYAVVLNGDITLLLDDKIGRAHV